MLSSCHIKNEATKNAMRHKPHKTIHTPVDGTKCIGVRSPMYLQFEPYSTRDNATYPAASIPAMSNQRVMCCNVNTCTFLQRCAVPETYWEVRITIFVCPRIQHHTLPSICSHPDPVRSYADNSGAHTIYVSIFFVNISCLRPRQIGIQEQFHST